MKGASAFLLSVVLTPGLARADDAPTSDPGAPPPAEVPAASPAPEPAPSTLPPPEPTPDRASRAVVASRTFVSLEVGYVLQNLYSVPIDGADISVAVGRERGAVVAGAIVEGTPGSTRDGLPTILVTVGPLLEGRIDRFRIGGGWRLGAFNVSRVTGEGNLLFSLSAGAFARVSCDVIDLDEAHKRAIFVIVKGSIDTVGSALYAASAGVGMRF